MATVLKRDTYLKKRHEEYEKKRRVYTDRLPKNQLIVRPYWLYTCIPLFFITPYIISIPVTFIVLLAVLVFKPAKLTSRELHALSELFREHLPWQQGLNGELAVERELDKLPSDYYVLHDITVNNHQIDHVVISFRGIVAIETKNYYGSYISVGDKWQQGKTQIKSPQYQAFNNARALSEYLGLEVQPVVVLTNAGFKGTGPCPVISLNNLISFILSLSSKLGNPQAIAEQLKNWRY